MWRNFGFLSGYISKTLRLCVCVGGGDLYPKRPLFVYCRQVARGDLLIYFNQIFDGLCKLFADVDTDVKNGSNLLDRLIKVRTNIIRNN